MLKVSLLRGLCFPTLPLFTHPGMAPAFLPIFSFLSSSWMTSGLPLVTGWTPHFHRPPRTSAAPSLQPPLPCPQPHPAPCPHPELCRLENLDFSSWPCERLLAAPAFPSLPPPMPVTVRSNPFRPSSHQALAGPTSHPTQPGLQVSHSS